MRLELIYINIWLWSTFVFCLIIFFKYINSTRCTLLEKTRVASVATIIYCVIFALWIGFRPLDQGGWADTINYLRIYASLMGESINVNAPDGSEAVFVVDTENEWLWDYIQKTFAYAHMPAEWFFFAVACGYIGFMYLGIRRMIPCNQWIALLFCISSFSFISYSYNGLRNGLACSIIIFALSFYIQLNKKGLIFGLLLSFLAMGIHRSTALPSLCALVAYFTKMDFKWAYSFWLISIVLSIIVGEQIQLFFANIGFDDRLQGYAGTMLSKQAKDIQQQFSHTGFRWDFLLYSAMPILLGYYIVYKKKIRDRVYELLIVTYTLSNAFWVMVIQSSYSNRFAYLSWFMYPIVFAYPLLKIKIWNDQDRKTAQILLLYVLFTVFLNIVYW